MNRLIFILLTLTLIIGCSDGSKVAGDTNSSETQNTLSVIQSNGQPAARMTVQIIDSRSWIDNVNNSESLIFYTTETNENGVFELPLDLPESFTILVSNDTEGAFEYFNSEFDSTLITYPLAQPQGHISGITENNIKVCLESTPYCTPLNQDGYYDFGNIPTSSYNLILFDSTESTINNVGSINVINSASAIDSIYYTPNYLLLDDFEDGDRYGSLFDWNETGVWWLFHNESTSNPDVASDIPTYIVDDTTDASNKVLQLAVDVPLVDYNNLSLLGINMGYGKTVADSLGVFVDLSQMDSLTFRMTGSDSIIVFLQTETIILLGDDKHFYKKIGLSDTWKTFTLTPEDFHPFINSLAESESLSFEDISTRVSSIVFQFNRSGDYQIDDIRLYGVNTLRLYDWDE